MSYQVWKVDFIYFDIDSKKKYAIRAFLPINDEDVGSHPYRLEPGDREYIQETLHSILKERCINASGVWLKEAEAAEMFPIMWEEA